MITHQDAQELMRSRDEFMKNKLDILSAMNSIVLEIGDEKDSKDNAEKKTRLRGLRGRLADMDELINDISTKLLGYFPTSPVAVAGMPTGRETTREVAVLLFSEKGELLVARHKGRTAQVLVLPVPKTATDAEHAAETAAKLTGSPMQLSFLTGTHTVTAGPEGLVGRSLQAYWGVCPRVDANQRFEYAAALGKPVTSCRMESILYPFSALKGDDRTLATLAAQALLLTLESKERTTEA